MSESNGFFGAEPPFFANGDVSASTRRNWLRLRPNRAEKLTSRANKRSSRKTSVPLEYFANRRNVPFVLEVARIVRGNGWNVADVLLSIALNMLRKDGLRRRANVRVVLEERAAEARPIRALERAALPDDEPDLLGLVYQSLLFEGAKNRSGAYYTPREIAAEMTRDVGETGAGGATFCDPCCGSGAFLLAAAARGVSPERLVGVDSDPNAVFAAKINLIRRFPARNFAPRIVCADFLRDVNPFGDENSLRFDAIATNPPWGAASSPIRIAPSEIASNETFALFFVRAFDRLKDGGRIRFLFPESILNVKAHRNVRTFLLERARILAITYYRSAFSGVSTKYVDVDVRRAPPGPTIVFRSDRAEKTVETASFFETANRAFRPLDSAELSIVRQMKERGKYSLRQSVWALGIVTGDNKSALFDRPGPSREPIFTGKEIAPFVLKPARVFLTFDRTRLQQAAKEDFYRAPEKLAYKFVSKRLVFAFDASKSLFLNSANVLIPRVPGVSIKTAAAFLNSELFQFYYLKLFGEIKVLQGNLCELPFPEISRERDARLAALVDSILAGDFAAFDAIQTEIFEVFGLNSAQVRRVRATVSDGDDFL